MTRTKESGMHPLRVLVIAVGTSLCLLGTAVLAAPAADGKQSDEASVELHSTITGNQEQPKVLYIVPWQGPAGVDQLNQGLQPIVSDVFAPVDRREFQRELKYREMTAAPTAN